MLSLPHLVALLLFAKSKRSWPTSSGAHLASLPPSELAFLSIHLVSRVCASIDVLVVASAQGSEAPGLAYGLTGILKNGRPDAHSPGRAKASRPICLNVHILKLDYASASPNRWFLRSQRSTKNSRIQHFGLWHINAALHEHAPP